MEKWCLYASLFNFDWIIIKVASNQDRHKSSVKFNFGPNQTTHFGVTCPWVTKISHFWTWISLKPVGQSWSNFMCSIIGVGERLHKVLGQIDLGTLDSDEWSLPFGLLVLLWQQLMQIVGQIWLNLVTWTCGSWSEGHHELYFTVQWFCLISWRQSDVCTSYLGSINQYGPMFDLKINVGHCDLYSMVQWFWLISWRLFDVWTLFRIMSQYDPKLDLKINISHCDIYFMVQWFCITSWRLFDIWTYYFGIMGQYDPTFDLKINVGLCDLYFMVLWFCLISPRLFDAWVSYFQIMRQCDPHFDLKVNMSTWPIFHGLVILPNIFKIIWWMNIIVGIMNQCDT